MAVVQKTMKSQYLKEFTMKLAPAFNKAKLVYYTNGVAGTVAAVNADGIIAPLTGRRAQTNRKMVLHCNMVMKKLQ